MSQERHSITLLRASLTVLLLVMTAGCREELGPVRFPTTRVSGTVTEGGRPLARGWIEFIPVDGTVGNLRTGRIQPDGSFAVDGVAIGENALRLAYAGIRFPGGEQLFGRFTTPIRRVVPAQSASPLKIELLEEAVRFQSARTRASKSISRAPTSGEEP